MAVNADEISTYFERLGWSYERPDASSFHTAVATRDGITPIHVHVDKRTVRFAVSTLAPDAEPPGDQALTVLLRANYEMNLTKFALDDDGAVCLRVELPADGFCFSHFKDALTALAHYTDTYGERVKAALLLDHAEVV